MQVDSKKRRGPIDLPLSTYFLNKANINTGVTSNQTDYYMAEFGRTDERFIYLDKLNYVQITFHWSVFQLIHNS